MSKVVKKSEIKISVDMCQQAWTIADYNAIVEKSGFIFRGTVLSASQATEQTYAPACVETTECKKTIVNALNSYTADSLKNYHFSLNGVELDVIELHQKVNKKIAMYAFSNGKLVYANITKKVLIYELSTFTKTSYSKVNSVLAKLAGRGDARVSKKDRQVVAVTTNDSFTL